MNWIRALSEIAQVAAEAVACRQCGFSADALRYPRTEAELIALCEFNGLKDHTKAPRGWRYFPNATMRDWWKARLA